MEDYKANSRGTETNLTIEREERDVRVKNEPRPIGPGLELGS